MGVLASEQVRRALEDVRDPHLRVPLSSLGMIREIAVDEGTVRVDLIFPCMACPALEMIREDVAACVARVDGVSAVEVCTTVNPQWSRTDVDEASKVELARIGIVI